MRNNFTHEKILGMLEIFQEQTHLLKLMAKNAEKREIRHQKAIINLKIMAYKIRFTERQVISFK